MLDVVIINAAHRGDWFINRLSKTKRSFQVYDLTKVLGAPAPDEVDGPFGVFGSEVLSGEQKKWLAPMQTSQRHGFSQWSDLGTLDGRGWVTSHQKNLAPAMNENILKSFLSTQDIPLKWLDEKSAPVDPFDDYFLLQPREILGTEVTSLDEFVFQVSDGRKSVRYQGREARAPFVVCFLTALEVMGFQEQGLPALLTSEPVRPRLAWQRLRLRLTTPVRAESLPMSSLLVSEQAGAWLEENFLLLKKAPVQSVGSLVVDVWYRAWFDAHKDEGYFNDILQKISAVVADKLVGTDVECLQKPSELKSAELMSLYPIYDLQEWETQTRWYREGCFCAGPDKVPTFLKSDAYRLQDRIFTSLDEGASHGRTLHAP